MHTAKPEHKPEISVLMPLYNRSQFLEEAVNSVLASTFTDYELIIVDDASTDNSFELAGDLAGRDPRIRLYRNDRNLGQFGNRNRCAELAEGTYLKYLDSDDTIYPHGLEVMHRSLAAFPGAGAAVSFDSADPERPYPHLLTPEEAYREHFFSKSPLVPGPSGIIFRKSAFRDLGGYPADPFVGSDTEFMLKLAARYPVVKMEPGLVMWRRHEGQDFEAGHRSGEYLFRNFRMQMDSLEAAGCPLPGPDKERARRQVKQHHARMILRQGLRLGRTSTARRLYRESGLTFRELLRGFWPYETR